MKSTNKTSAGLNIGSQQRQSIKSRADKVLGASGSLSTKSGKSTSAKVPPPMSSKTSKSLAGSALTQKNAAKKTGLTDKQKLYAEFEREEQEYREAFADFDFDSAWNKPKTPEEIAEMALHQEAAKNFFKKDARVNFRISQRDLDLLKQKANSEGMPYQTMLGSLVHKFVNNMI